MGGEEKREEERDGLEELCKFQRSVVFFPFSPSEALLPLTSLPMFPKGTGDRARGRGRGSADIHSEAAACPPSSRRNSPATWA